MPVGLEDLLWKSQGGVRVRRVVPGPDSALRRTRGSNEPMSKGVLMFLPDEGSFLLYWMRCSLQRSLRRVRSNVRLYQALAAQETNEASRERYGLLAVNARRRVTRKLESLFSLCGDLQVDRDRLLPGLGAGC